MSTDASSPASSPAIVLAPSTPPRHRSVKFGDDETGSLRPLSLSPCPSVDSGIEDVFGSPSPDKLSAAAVDTQGEKTTRSKERRKFMANNPFENDKTRILFTAVDRLRVWRAQDHVSIPELVIVGGQSSGKSSVLKGLTNIPFPIFGKCCTRFPTRIVLKRTAPGTREFYRITIESPDVQVNGLAQLTDDFSEFECSGGSLTEEKFIEAIEDASQNWMAIRNGQGSGKRNFVANVLRVELCGPDFPHMSILDLPGIVCAANTVKEEEKVGLNEMVVEYMKQPQNIVICVVSAHTPLDYQEILQLAGQHTEPHRLVGVLTKCDKVDEPEMKYHWTDFALNHSNAGAHAICDNWFVVRNRHSMDDDSFDIGVVENRLFRAKPWSSISKNRRGISALRTHISGILTEKLRSDFPCIRKGIEDLIVGKENERSALGEPRIDHASRRKYLLDCVDKMTKSVEQALYKPLESSEPTKRLRPLVKDLKDYFEASMRAFGHSWAFEGYEASRATVPEVPRSLPQDLQKNADFPEHIKAVQDSKSLLAEIVDQFSVLQATQLPGVTNPDIYPSMHSRQTAKWEAMALLHLECVREAVGYLLWKNLEDFCPCQGSTYTLNQGLVSLAQGMLNTTLEKAQEAIKAYCAKQTDPRRTLLSTDAVFAERLQKCQRKRFKQALMASVEQLRTMSDKFEATEEFYDQAYDRSHHKKDGNLALEAHDILQIHYELSLEHFIRTVTDDIVENFLLHEEGPLIGLNADLVRNLSESTVEQLAREDDAAMAARERLESDIHNLKKALAIAEDAVQQTR